MEEEWYTGSRVLFPMINFIRIYTMIFSGEQSVLRSSNETVGTVNYFPA